MDYPTDEELAEYHGMFSDAPVIQPSPIKTPSANQDGHSFFQSNSQLSQIRPSNGNETSGLVNRRLIETPVPATSAVSQRISSTPIGTDAVAGPSNPFRHLFDDDELEYAHNGNADLNPRKRRLEDLFGDIDDIVDDEDLGKVYYGFETDDNLRKKARCEETADRELIEKILAIRAANRTNATDRSKRTKLEQLEALQKFKTRNLSESYPNWPSIPVLGDSCERIYVRMHSEEFETNQLNDVNFRNGFANLLGQSSDRVWDEAQAIVHRRLTEPTAAVQATSEQLNGLQIFTDSSVPPKTKSDRLWVDKYRPQGYFDLLSDESTNRGLLTWLKMWDKMVFHKEFKMNSKLTEAQKQSGSNFNKKTGRFDVGGVRYRKIRQTDLKTEIDSFGRPVQKIAVLCGPPGLGKTTLAHTIARHAGYAVREINASDDRSPEYFRLALQNGTEMQTTLLNQERRPNCIILDEIDGAPIASIDFLIRFINDSSKETPKQSNKVGTKATKSKTTGILRRPIICICNDIYTPSLRALRQVAFVVTFPPLNASRLAERLQSICRKERLRTDMTALLALVDKSGNDVRSCISILQFYANNNRPLTLIDVLNSNIGQKDRQKGLFDIWSTIFQVQRSKQVLATEKKSDETVADVAIVDTSLKSRVETVISVVQMGGDYERLLNGVHENYLNQKMPDANLNGLTVATEWFCFSDQLHTLIQTQQNYVVYPYLHYSFAVWHLLFASLAWPKIVFPTKGYEFYQKSILQKSIRAALAKNVSVPVRSLGNSSTIISDAIAHIRQIICPALRSVTLQLLTPKERSDLRHTVEVMADLGLSYSQLKSIDGTYQYQLEPDINQLCNFKVVPRSNELTYSNMQIIAREVELELMRRSAPRQAAADNQQKNAENARKRILQMSNKPNHLQRLVSKPITSAKVKETISKDFFGRITEKQVALSVQEGGTDLIVKSPIWYRYKEGFNNAVRKDVTMKSLM